MLHAIFCTDKSDHVQVRLDNRMAHVEHLKSIGARLIFAGPTLMDDFETMNGSLIVVDFDTRAEVDAFVQRDPYVRAGLFTSVAVRPWKKVLP